MPILVLGAMLILIANIFRFVLIMTIVIHGHTHTHTHMDNKQVHAAHLQANPRTCL